MKKLKFNKKLLTMGVMLASVFTLAACSQDNGETIVTYKNGSLTADEAYNIVKYTSTVQEQVKNLVVLDIFYNQYGDKIKDSEVDKIYNNYKASSTSEDVFNDSLKKSGYTEESFKEHIKKQLAYEYGIAENIKVTDAEIQAEWETYKPSQQIKLMVFADKETAEAAKQAVDGGNDFDSVASEKSTTNIVDYNLTYNDVNIPDKIKEEIYKLKNNQVSSVLSYEDTTYGVTYYYVVKMIAAQAKPAEMTDDIKKEIELVIKGNKTQDTTVTNAIIKSVLEKNNFNLKDTDYSNVFNDFITAGTTESSSTKESSSSTE